MTPTYAAGSDFIVHKSGKRLTKAEALAELVHHLSVAKSLTACPACVASANAMVAEITAAMAATWPDHRESAA